MLASGLLFLIGAAVAQVNKENSLTPDAYWHNRYHAILSMSAYGDFNTTCPLETFTEEAKDRNFPNSPYPPWTVVNTFGPTASGAQGFTAIVPEMNKALIVFQGKYALEQSLPTETSELDVLDPHLAGVCNYFAHLNVDATQNCTVNAFALQGYMEAKAATNDWADIIDAYSGAGLVFSIAGHGLGGMHSIIAALDLNIQNISYYHHTYGTPRTLNPGAAWYYNYNFWGESGERGVANDDVYTESIPASNSYEHAGTTFYYSGFNNTALGPAWTICWDLNDPACSPEPTGNSTQLEDHYFYFANVGTCGGDYKQNRGIIDNYLLSIGVVDDGTVAPAGYNPPAQNPQPVGPAQQTTTSTTYYYEATTAYVPVESTTDYYTPTTNNYVAPTTTRAVRTRTTATRAHRTRTTQNLAPTPTDSVGQDPGETEGPAGGPGAK